MKKFLITSVIILLSYLNQTYSADKARGFFISFGVGPRLPIAAFSTTTDLGYGFNLEISYTDNEYLPVFLFTKVGYEQFMGSQSYYESSDYAGLSTAAIPINAGARYFFPPILESAFLMMPLAEASISMTYLKEFHQFKLSSGRSNFYNEKFNFGFSAGVGISMFLMEILASYNYLPNNQFVSADLKIRLPLLVIF